MDHFYNREMRKIFEIFLIKKIIHLTSFNFMKNVITNRLEYHLM